MRKLRFILAMVATTMVVIACGSGTQTSSQGDAMEVIMTRTSVRSYTNKVVEQDKIEQLLRAAMTAPPAANKQHWAFVVVDDKTVLEQMQQAHKNGKMIANAPLAIVVCGDMSKALDGEGAEFWIQDTSAATENLLLAAHALGLGAVWVGVHPISERVVSISGILSLPENIVPLAIVPIGYPDSHNEPKDKWNPEQVHYNRW